MIIRISGEEQRINFLDIRESVPIRIQVFNLTESINVPAIAQVCRAISIECRYAVRMTQAARVEACPADKRVF